MPDTAGRVRSAVVRGVASIGALFLMPLAAVLMADALVGLPRWLVYAPVICWAGFTALFLCIAAYAVNVTTPASTSADRP